MVLKGLVAKTATVARNFSTTSVRQHGHNVRGIVGSNLPFQIENKPRFTAVFILYFASGLGLPFLILRHSILKRNSG